MEQEFHFLGWNMLQVWQGFLRKGDVRWTRVDLDWQPGGIRNCSYAPQKDWIGITAEDRAHGGQVLAIYQRRTARTRTLSREGYFLHHDLNHAGSKVCYSRPSARRGTADLYLYKLTGEQSHCLARSVAAQDAVPTWFPDDTRIAYHTAEGMVEVLHLDDSRRESVVEGRSPAISPDGRRIAFHRDNQLWLWDLGRRDGQRLGGGRKWSRRSLTNGSSWSPDGCFLTFGQVSGLTDKSVAFYRLDLASGERHRIKARYLSALSFVAQKGTSEQGQS